MDLFGTGQADSSSSDEEQEASPQPGQQTATGLVSVLDPGAKGISTKDGIVFDMLPQRSPQDTMFEEGMMNMNNFFEKINQFEKITNQSLEDIWKQPGPFFQPLKVKLDLQEYVPGLFDLLRPIPKVPISKVMSVFCFLQIETHNLKHEIESRFYDPLILFGESGLVFEEEDQNQSGEQELQISRTLKVYNQFFDVVRRIVDLSKNIVYQMNGLFQSKDKMYQNSFKKLVYHVIFDNFGEILTTLYIVDLIIQENTNFVQFWEQYNQMFMMAQTNPGKYNITMKNLKKVMKFCQKIYQNILSGKLYDDYLDGLCKTIQDETGKDFVFKNKCFKEKYLEYIKYKIELVNIKLSNSSDMEAHSAYMTLLINYSLYRKLFNDEDSKLYKRIWSLQKMCPIIILYNNLCLNPGSFLAKKCPLKKNPKTEPKDINEFLGSELVQKDQEFSEKVDSFYFKLVNWVIKMNSDAIMDTGNHQTLGRNAEFLKTRANLIITGLNMATEIKRHVKTLILMYQTCKQQPSKQRLHDIVRSIEMLKAIEIEFNKKRYLINQWISLINRYTSEMIDQIIVKGINSVGQWYSKGQFYEDMMFLLTTIYESHQGGHNFMRSTVIYHCFNLMKGQVFVQKELGDIRYLCQRLEMITDWEKIIKRSTRCRFIYWIRSLFPYIFEMILADSKRPNQFNYFLMALNDPLDMLWNVKHFAEPNVAVENYKKEVFKAFSDKVVKPICRKVEEEIRVQIHQAIIPNLAQKNPWESRPFDSNKYLMMSTLYLFEKQISIKEEVRHYLSKIFYQMSALVPHDFQTYEHMRVLAKEKFGMDLVKSHLPSQQLEQGIDILQLLRDLGKYVSKYNYNLHTQTMIETTTETKQIKTIGVNQMVYSIKTHGIGVMGTVVNTFYKFLVKKLNIFNEFLYDEFISNPLMQEQRYYKKHKQDLNNMYPFERAENMCKQIKRLGQSKSGTNYLEKFRQLITHIGNALGYVRMIRSAALKDNANLVKYLPDFIANVRFEDIADELGIQSETLESIKVFDMCVRNLFKQADDAGDYLRMIVQNFEGIGKQENTKHLKLFYLMVPPLTLSFMEHVQRGKEKLQGKNQNVGAFLSDDGFALGIAYLLKILGQTDRFKNLNWFESMFGKIEKDLFRAEQKDKANTEEQQYGYSHYEENKMDHEMSKKKTKKTQVEFEMLNFTFTASQILFKEI